MLKDIVKNPEEQSVRGPSEAKHERDGQSPQDVEQLAEAGNGSSKMLFAQRSHAKDIGPQAWSPSDHFDGKRFFNPTLPKDFAPSRWSTLKMVREPRSRWPRSGMSRNPAAQRAKSFRCWR